MTQLLLDQLNFQQSADPTGYLSSILSDNQYKFFFYIFSKTTNYRSFYYSQERIADELGISISTVKRYSAVLEALNIVKVIHRGYLKTNLYVMHEFYKKNKHLFFSKYKNFLNKGLLTISETALRLRELLLRNNVVINLLYQRTSFEEEEKKMFQLSDEQTLESKKFPRWVYDRALSIVKVKIEHGQEIKNPASFFMAVLRGEAAKRQQPHQQRVPKEPQKGVKSQPYARPSTGPYAIYQPREKVLTETDFERAQKLEQDFHNNAGNIWKKVVADMMINNISEMQKNEILNAIHTEMCNCRPDVIFKKKELVNPIEDLFEDEYEQLDDFVV